MDVHPLPLLYTCKEALVQTRGLLPSFLCMNSKCNIKICVCGLVSKLNSENLYSIPLKSLDPVFKVSIGPF